jgi:hypothetical protein
LPDREKNFVLETGLWPKASNAVHTRVARFFMVHDTKNRKNVQNVHKMYQMVIKYHKWS